MKQGPQEPDRRQYYRIHKHFVLNYFELQDPQNRHNASQLKNISLGGLCLITAKQYGFGAQLGIELKTPFFHEFVFLEGTVLDSKERMKDIIYETRVRFDTLSPQAEMVLKKLIQHFEHEEKKNNE